MRHLPLLLLLAFSAACQSPAPPPAPPTPPFQADLGLIDTPWGKIHAYDRLMPARTVAPVIPAEFRRPGFGATVIATLLVNPDGSVADARIGRSSGHPALDQAALHALKQWRFPPPATGERVATAQPIVFNVDQGSSPPQMR